MSLVSGSYLTKVERTVVVWPAPDKHGNADVVWVEQKDSQGRNIGRLKLKDQWGNEVRSYRPPDGFQNRPGYDNSPNFVKVDNFGEVYRQPNGEAVCIKPGQGVVFNPDGSTEVLDDEYAQYVFEQMHDSSNVVVLDDGAVKDREDSVGTEQDEEQDEEAALLARLEELRAEKEKSLA